MSKLEFDNGKNRNYESKTICDSIVYVRESEDYLSTFYYLVL